MKILGSILFAVMAIGLLYLAKRASVASRPGCSCPPDQASTLEQKLEILADCGLQLAPDFAVDDLLLSWDRETYEEPGFDLVLVGLGTPQEEDPYKNRCVNLWHFDTECIADHGDYKKIVERMAEMTKGSLLLSNIRDHVDLLKHEARFSFDFQGQTIKVECTVDDDWVDTSVFSRFVELLYMADPSRVYIYYDLGGQDCILGCVAREQLKKLNSYGIRFVPLS